MMHMYAHNHEHDGIKKRGKKQPETSADLEIEMDEFRKKVARIRKPNWMAAFCGAAYLFCFLALPVYSYGRMPLTGGKLLPAAPLSWLMLLSGAAMVVCPLFMKRKVGLWVGLASLVITGLSGLLGAWVLGGKSTMEALHIYLNYTGYRVLRVPVSTGYFLCLVCAAVFCVMEWHADWLHRKHKRFLDRYGNRIYRDRNGNDMHIGL